MLGDTMTVERLLRRAGRCTCQDCRAGRGAYRRSTRQQHTELRRAVATFARLRNLCGEAADMLDSMPWRNGACDLRERLPGSGGEQVKRLSRWQKPQALSPTSCALGRRDRRAALTKNMYTSPRPRDDDWTLERSWIVPEGSGRRRGMRWRGVGHEPTGRTSRG